MMEWRPEFTRNFHMDKEQFDELYQRLRHRLEAKKYSRPDCISSIHRLAYTLE